MGYSGQPMKVIKANRALLKKRNTFKKVKEMFLETANKTEVAFKEVSPEKLARIKAEIRRKAKAAAWREAAFYLVGIAIMLYVLYGLLFSV